MAFNNRRTYLCYDNSDLIRDGYIKTSINKEYVPVDTFNINRLKNPPKGTVYIVDRDEDGNIIKVVERKKLLPASKIKVEIDFSKVMKSAVRNPISPGALSFIPMMGLIGNFALPSMGFGGVTSGLTYITLHLLDAETKINYPIKVNQQILDTGIISLNSYPLSVFGIVKRHIITEEEDENNVDRVVGLPFTPEQLDILGKYSDGTWRGSRRKRIDGATDSDGLFGGAGDEEVKFEDVKYEDQEQLFIKVVRDERKLKFRGDNYDASGGKAYPYKLSGVAGIDATDKQIRIDVSDLVIGETIYITYSVASNRHLRQNLSHLGKIGQGNTIGISGFIGAIASDVDAWNYQIKTWKVPKLPTGLTIYNIDLLEDYYSSDSDYVLASSNYFTIKRREREEDDFNLTDVADEIEGWRLSESISTSVKKFWAADYRGVLLYDDGDITVMLPRSEIRDQDWFTDYLEGLDFTYPSGTDGSYLPSDLNISIENRIDLDREPGYLFDISEVANSLLFDREKIPYYRPFAEALKNVSTYSDDSDTSGVGISHLDIMSLSSSIDLKYYDLSFIDFETANAQPLKSYSCEEPFHIHSYNYWSQNYDAQSEGPGAWYDVDHIENEVFEWRPSGASIESYWKAETPYFCGNFTRRTRVYIEKMAGNSLDNYSWIYVDTQPFVPHNISLDTNNYIGASTLAFNDENVNYGLSYHKLNDDFFEGQLQALHIDTSKSHVKDAYNHDGSLIVGQNRILGDRPSYSHGSPVADDIINICRMEDIEEGDFWWTEELYDGTGSAFNLDFDDDPPKLIIPSDWYVKRLEIEFSYANYETLTEKEKYISFYFEQTESSVSNFRVFKSGATIDGTTKMIVDFNYYYGGPVQFLGAFWKKIDITKIDGRFVGVSNPNSTLQLDLDSYKIKSGQSAVVYDGMGELLVFYANTTSGNIDVATSLNDGEEWLIHRDLIRLVEGEFAGMPFVIKDVNSDYIHLFYTLNGSFLMYKRINTNLLVEEDAFVEYAVPSSYDVGDYDQSLDDPERAYWGNYSTEGLSLRRFPSYFIDGYFDDEYFKDQIEIRDNINIYNEDPPNPATFDTDKKQIPRFEFSGNTNEMKGDFEGNPYAVYLDGEGILRLFMLKEGKLSVKRSDNYFTWSYDIEEQVIHKTYLDDELNRGLSEEIQNIQIVRNDYNTNLVSVLYFHYGMLFIRHFYSDLLFPYYDSSGNKYDDQMREHLKITEDTVHRPIFLVGKIPDNIKGVKIGEIDDGINDSDSSLFIRFPYDKEMLERFDERFEVDSDTQVYAYTTVNGLIRVFYKDSFGNLNGIIIDGLDNLTLEVMNIL